MITTFPLGSYRGRIENMAAYVRCGKQVFRSINNRPCNPRTFSQMRQRTKLSNILSAYRILSSFVRESYQTRPPSLTAYNVFVRNNLKATEIFLDKREALAEACVVDEFNISEGTLPPIETTVSDNRLVTSLQLPAGFSIDETTTLGEVSSSLVGCNASLRYGDKISILYLIQVRPQREINFYMPHAELKLYEFVLEGDSRIPFYTLVDERLFRAKDGYVCTDEQVGEGAVGYVHSRKTKRCTEYSTQSLVLLPGTMLCRTYGSIEKSYEAAASYGTKIESGKLKMESEELKKDKTTATKAVARACPNETKGASKATGQGISKEPMKAGQIRKLKAKKKKRDKRININKKGNKNGKKKEKRIRGKP
ncbi:hypothetical protein EZS27_001066 [termite gut metagenome]|uniref:Uncharacterized protein n=1 Tax=termite gut metagenome TaxID=433724 RepID=A0A5J4T1L8_9ZZZZ